MYELLKGMTVVEGAAFIAGPTCTLYMAQMGAEVIRFDQIGGGPDSKRWPLGQDGRSLYWEGINKGKKSVAIDLGRPEGKELAQRLATAGDGLFVTNFPSNGFLSYDALSTLRNDLVCLRIMGWADGRPAVDYTINAAVGLPWMTGHADDPRPVNHVLPAWDLLAGAYAAFMLVSAERERAQSGKGREIRLALSDLAAATIGTLGMVAETLAHGDRGRAGNDLFGAFGRDFLTSDGHRLMIVAITPRQWTGLIKLLALEPQVATIEQQRGVSFATDEGLRFRHRDQLVPAFERAFAARTLGDLEPDFERLGICWSHYRALSEALEKEPVLFGGNPIFASVMHPSGTYATPGAAARIAQDARCDAMAAPVIGQHTDEVLSCHLGLGSTEIANLHDAGIVSGP